MNRIKILTMKVVSYRFGKQARLLALAALFKTRLHPVAVVIAGAAFGILFL